MILLAGKNALDFILILIIFVLVLGATYFITKWAANIQKGQGAQGDIELLRCAALGTGKYIQIVRVGNHYYSLAVCKDTVTLLGEISPEELKPAETPAEGLKFKDFLDKARRRDKNDTTDLKDITDEKSQTL